MDPGEIIMAGKSEYSRKLDYNNAYNRKTYKSFSVRFNKNSESELIQWLESKEGLKDYIVVLIKKDMEKASRKQSRKKAEKENGKKKSKRKSEKKSGKK